MAGKHDEHGPIGYGGHGSPHPMAWVDQHMGGMVESFGKVFEAAAENFMFFIVNDILRRLAILCLIIMTPVLLVEFLVHTVWF